LLGVLYVAVVLIRGKIPRRRSVLLVALGCVSLA